MNLIIRYMIKCYLFELQVGFDNVKLVRFCLIF